MNPEKKRAEINARIFLADPSKNKSSSVDQNESKGINIDSTCLYVFLKTVSAIEDLKKTVALLRSPDGCPWDREQTHQSLADCLVEECCEVLDTIDRNDMEHMREELGDLLLQVLMHAQMAEEQGLFNLEMVAADINAKLIRRHPHVFGEEELLDPDQVLKRWEEIKATEKADTTQSLFARLPPRLPALLFAWKVYKKIQRGKLDPGASINEDKVSKIARGLNEESAGRLLFEIAAACRRLKIDPESALRRYTRRVIKAVEKHEREEC